jgi:hypothetical protein
MCDRIGALQADRAFVTKESGSIPCRLCAGNAELTFTQRVIDRYDVGYFVCNECESLQTERPFWLGEAYSEAVTPIDPGAAQRVLDNFVIVRMVAYLFACRRILDFGGGAGLLCRLLRDAGWDAYSFDRYCAPGYAAGFTAAPSEHFDLVTAFEVIEHFPDPAMDLIEIFSGAPNVVLISLELYSGQEDDWWYLCPQEGQHVFMYSRKAIELVAHRFGYRAEICRGFVVFVHGQLSMLRQALLRRLLMPMVVRLLRPFALARSGGGAAQDFSLMTKR